MTVWAVPLCGPQKRNKLQACATAQHRNPWVSRHRLSGLLYTCYCTCLASILCVAGLHSQVGNISCVLKSDFSMYKRKRLIPKLWTVNTPAGLYPIHPDNPVFAFCLFCICIPAGRHTKGVFLSIWRLLAFTHHCYYCNEVQVWPLLEDISIIRPLCDYTLCKIQSDQLECRCKQ